MEGRLKEMKITAKSTISGPEKEKLETLMKRLDNLTEEILNAAKGSPNFTVATNRCLADGNLEVSVKREDLAQAL